MINKENIKFETTEGTTQTRIRATIVIQSEYLVENNVTNMVPDESIIKEILTEQILQNIYEEKNEIIRLLNDKLLAAGTIVEEIKWKLV